LIDVILSIIHFVKLVWWL